LHLRQDYPRIVAKISFASTELSPLDLLTRPARGT
jgi:hypothetical protein